MNESLNELEEFEFDEATLKFLERKYRNKIALSVITVIIALIAIAFSVYVFTGNCKIIKEVNGAQTSFAEENYEAAINGYISVEKSVENLNKTVPFFRAGSKAFWGYMEAYEKTNGPVECKKLLDKYYSDGKYPQRSVNILENAKLFTKAYNELNTLISSVKSYAAAYEGIEKIGADNPDYPKYVVLYFHLLATQKFEGSPNTQLSAYKALEKEAPDATWLYDYAGTKTLITAGELNTALRLCPEDGSEESKTLRLRIYRMSGEYKEATMLYDEYRDFDIPSEELDRQMIILHLLQNNARIAIEAFSQYTENLDLCESEEMLYTLQIAAIKANDDALLKKITKHLKKEKIPTSKTVSEYELGFLKLEDIFLNGESELN